MRFPDSNGATYSRPFRTASARGSWAGISRCPVTARSATSTTATRLAEERATYAFSSDAKATPTGSSNRVARESGSRSCTVATTCRNVGLPGRRSMTLTESETWFETHTSPPSGRTASPTGSIPTGTRATSSRVFASSTSTVSAGVLQTNTRPPTTATGFACGLANVGRPTAAGAATRSGGGGGAGADRSRSAGVGPNASPQARLTPRAASGHETNAFGIGGLLLVTGAV